MRGLRIVETRRARALRLEAPSAERVVWRLLRNRQLGGWKFVRQEPIGPFFADFICREKKLVVEIDGATHSSDSEVASDARRTAFLEAEGYRVMRFSNEQIFENIAGALEAILLVLVGGQSPMPLTLPLPAKRRGEGTESAVRLRRGKAAVSLGIGRSAPSAEGRWSIFRIPERSSAG